MVTRDLTKVLQDQYPAETQTRDYLDQLAALTAIPATHQAGAGRREGPGRSADTDRPVA